MKSVLVKSLISTTVSMKGQKEVPITMEVSDKLKSGSKNIFCQNEVPYKALIPGYKGRQRMDLVCFYNGEMEVLEFKLFDQEIINVNYSAKNAIRVVLNDIEKLNSLYEQKEYDKYPIGLATLTFVCAVFNSNISGKTTYKEALQSIIPTLEEDGFEVKTMSKGDIFFLIASY